MRVPLRILSLVSIILLLCSCTQPETPLPATPEPEDTPTPRATRKILADTFFFGHAYLDANGNDEIDEDDPGLKGALFMVSPSGGAGLTAYAGSDGSAFIVIPGGLRETDWPVMARMEPPPDSSYELVGPEEVVLEYPKSSADFLFTEAQQGE
jgi:hypothetical protein